MDCELNSASYMPTFWDTITHTQLCCKLQLSGLYSPLYSHFLVQGKRMFSTFNVISSMVATKCKKQLCDLVLEPECGMQMFLS